MPELYQAKFVRFILESATENIYEIPYSECFQPGNKVSNHYIFTWVTSIA